MNKNKIKKIILETLKELFEDMNYYPDEGDTFYGSLYDEVKEKLEADVLSTPAKGSVGAEEGQ